jgi:hypothetical protein
MFQPEATNSKTFQIEAIKNRTPQPEATNHKIFQIEIINNKIS